MFRLQPHNRAVSSDRDVANWLRPTGNEPELVADQHCYRHCDYLVKRDDLYETGNTRDQTVSE